MAARQVEFLMAGSRKADGTVNAAGYCYFLNTGADTYQAVYDTKALNAYTTTAGTGTDPIAGVEYVLLDSGGKPTQGDVFADGTYNIKIYESDGTLVDTIDDATYEVPASASARSTADKTGNFAVESSTLVDVYFVTPAAGTTATFNANMAVATLDAGTRVEFVNMDGAFDVVLTPSPGDTINGAATYTLDTARQSVTIENDGSGTDWVIVNGVSSASVPTIDDFTNANHTHLGASTGGAIATTPPGVIIAYTAETSPDTAAWLVCNGQSVSRTTYSALFGIIAVIYGSASGSTFNVPDYRGRFLRGWDDAEGTDPDAATRTDSGDGVTTGDSVGTQQEHAIRAHTHDTIPASSSISQDQDGPSFTHISGSTVSGAVTAGATSTESRPTNITVNWLIKT